MKKLILLALFSAGLNLTFAQTSGQVANYTGGSADGGVSDAFYNYTSGSITDKQEKTNYVDNRIEGSPYLSNVFYPGKMYYEEEFIGETYFRYNAHNEEIELKKNNLETEAIKALMKDKKIKLFVDGTPLVFKTYITKADHTKNGYLMLLSDGEYKLYKRTKISFHEAKKAENTFVKSKPARFVQATEYYLEFQGGKKISQIELNAKKILGLLPNDKSKGLKEHLKGSKIKTEADLIKVTQFLNG